MESIMTCARIRLSRVNARAVCGAVVYLLLALVRLYKTNNMTDMHLINNTVSQWSLEKACNFLDV